LTGGALPVADPWFVLDAVAPGVVRITEPHLDVLIRANLYLIEGRTHDLLVDSGMGVGRLRPVLDRPVTKPLILFTTHAHVDHIGGHHEFPDAEILVHPAEAEALRRPDLPPGLGFDQFEPATRADLEALGFRTEGSLIDALPRAGYDPDRYRCIGAEPSRLVEEGDTVELGDRRFEVLHLPGHSPGGLALWEPASGVLVAGDTLYDGLLLDMIAGASIPDYRESLRRLRDLPVTRVLGGHREPFGRDRMVELVDLYLAWRKP
jgi:glyoxylase-like metal-dependent hydrolase (beta-lactamase superfamily II)